MNCKNCKYWIKKTETSEPPLFGECLRVSESDYRTDNWINPIGHDVDGLETREDFGCILFEQKEQ